MKYFNKKTVYQGIKFDSNAERDRYIVLKDMERRGEISGLVLQKYFEVLPKQVVYKTIKLKTKTKIIERVDEKAVGYHCDFYYYDCKRNVYVIEEVKSKETAKARDYPLRRKLVKLMIRRANERSRNNYVFNEIIVK